MTDPTGQWRDRLRADRERREAYFAEDPHSPVPGDEFAGLSYYAPDPEYRFELPLHEHEEREQLTVETTAGGEREYLRWGEFRFAVDGEEVILQTYRSDPGEDRFWVPFRDATSGEETYGAGRYVDLVGSEHESDGTWELDFNRAYNPTCAYNEAYACPLVPTENWLDVRIAAGEKAYPGEPVPADHGQSHDGQ